ncbi:MAG: ABC transporter substrate-binding protein [Actinomycetota bacterium]
MKRLRLIVLFLASLAAAAVVLATAFSSASAKPRVIALVQLTSVDENTVLGFKEGMEQLGYREGSDVVYLSHGPIGSAQLLEGVIREHLEKKPDLFFVSSTPATQAVKRLTEGRQSPPVVFGPVNDPLNAGVVSDLRHPGGHITGVRLPMGEELRLQWLVRIAPGVRRIYVPYTADDKSALNSLRRAAEAAEKLGLSLLADPVDGNDGVAASIAALPPYAQAIFLPRDSRVEVHIGEFVAAAERLRLPLSAPSLSQVEAGALFSYGFAHKGIGRQAARLADQIFKGARPGDLPVEMAETRLAINLDAARRIGVPIPDEVLLQADYTIGR